MAVIILIAIGVMVYLYSRNNLFRKRSAERLPFNNQSYISGSPFEVSSQEERFDYGESVELTPHLKQT